MSGPGIAAISSRISSKGSPEAAMSRSIANSGAANDSVAARLPLLL
jgi:hypothetical protein